MPFSQMLEYSQLELVEGAQVASSSHTVIKMYYINSQGERIDGYYKGLDEQRGYPALVAAFCIAIATFLNMFTDRTPADCLVLDNAGNVKGTFSPGFDIFTPHEGLDTYTGIFAVWEVLKEARPISFDDPTFCEKEAAFCERVANLLHLDFHIILFLSIIIRNEDLHIKNLSKEGFMIDFDMALCFILGILRGGFRFIEAMGIKDMPNSELPPETWSNFPCTKANFGPTKKVPPNGNYKKAFVAVLEFRSLMSNPRMYGFFPWVDSIEKVKEGAFYVRVSDFYLEYQMREALSNQVICDAIPLVDIFLTNIFQLNQFKEKILKLMSEQTGLLLTRAYLFTFDKSVKPAADKIQIQITEKALIYSVVSPESGTTEPGIYQGEIPINAFIDDVTIPKIRSCAAQIIAITNKRGHTNPSHEVQKGTLSAQDLLFQAMTRYLLLYDPDIFEARLKIALGDKLLKEYFNSAALDSAIISELKKTFPLWFNETTEQMPLIKLIRRIFSYLHDINYRSIVFYQGDKKNLGGVSVPPFFNAFSTLNQGNVLANEIIAYAEADTAALKKDGLNSDACHDVEKIKGRVAELLRNSRAPMLTQLINDADKALLKLWNTFNISPSYDVPPNSPIPQYDANTQTIEDVVKFPAPHKKQVMDTMALRVYNASKGTIEQLKSDLKRYAGIKRLKMTIEMSRDFYQEFVSPLETFRARLSDCFVDIRGRDVGLISYQEGASLDFLFKTLWGSAVLEQVQSFLFILDAMKSVCSPIDNIITEFPLPPIVLHPYVEEILSRSPKTLDVIEKAIALMFAFATELKNKNEPAFWIKLGQCIKAYIPNKVNFFAKRTRSDDVLKQLAPYIGTVFIKIKGPLPEDTDGCRKELVRCVKEKISYFSKVVKILALDETMNKAYISQITDTGERGIDLLADEEKMNSLGSLTSFAILNDSKLSLTGDEVLALILAEGGITSTSLNTIIVSTFLPAALLHSSFTNQIVIPKIQEGLGCCLDSYTEHAQREAAKRYPLKKADTIKPAVTNVSILFEHKSKTLDFHKKDDREKFWSSFYTLVEEIGGKEYEALLTERIKSYKRAGWLGTRKRGPFLNEILRQYQSEKCLTNAKATQLLFSEGKTDSGSFNSTFFKGLYEAIQTIIINKSLRGSDVSIFQQYEHTKHWALLALDFVAINAQKRSVARVESLYGSQSL